MDFSDLSGFGLRFTLVLLAQGFLGSGFCCVDGNWGSRLCFCGRKVKES